jgi:hypothetical protein
MNCTTYCDRRVAEIENDTLLLTVTEEGGHLARILHKPTGVNPLWTSSWPSIEPSAYSPETHPGYGAGEGQLVAAMLGHILCLDLFGAPTDEEAAAGIPVHGEAAVAPYTLSGTPDTITLTAALPTAQMAFTRTLRLAPGGVVHLRETVTNLSATDRPIGWTQHVTLGAPFLQPGQTRLLLSATHSRVYEADFNDGLGAQAPGADFIWPLCPLRTGGTEDLSALTAAPVSGGFTAHLMDPTSPHAFFVAWSPSLKLLVGYAWKRDDFPWLARWEENHLRPWAPWNGQGYALGMEFGVSPMVENRRQMVARGEMFGAPTFLWLGARSSRTVEYVAFVRSAEILPTTVRWNGVDEVEFLDAEGNSL